MAALLQICTAMCAISPKKKKSRPSIKAEINGQEVEFLLDTGASISLIAKDCWDRIKPDNYQQLPFSQSTRISGITGHGIQVVECVEININIMGREITRPIAIVEGVSHCEGLLGWDTIKQEGITLEGSTSSAFFEDDNNQETWEVAALVAPKETKIMPRSVHKFQAIAMQHETHLQKGEEGICTPCPKSPLGMWECIAAVQEQGKTTVTVINTTDKVVRLEGGQQIGNIRNPRVSGETLSPLDEQYLASIMGEIGQEPEEPKRGRIKPLSRQEETDLRAKLHVKAPEPWKRKFEDLIVDYHDVCSRTKYDLGRASVIKHSIRMKDDVPTHARQFPIPLAHQEYVREYVDELLKQGAIEVSRSPYNSPIFCVTKKTPPDWPVGAPPPLRCVLDYRKVNEKSLPDRYAIREVREYIDEVGKKGSAWFSALDLTSGFWQQELEQQSRQYTAFTVPGQNARYQWKVTPMGLQGSPASFARLMDHIMRGIEGVLTYIDDVLVHAKGPEEHLRILEEALLRMRKFGMKLNMDKSIFAADEVQYLGYTVSSKGVSLSTDKLKAIKEAKAPQSIKQIREFVGLTNYFRFLVPNFSRISTVLTSLIKKGSGYTCGVMPREAIEAFEKLKNYLCTPPIVGFPKADRTFILHSDGCAGDKDNPGGLGACLSQIQDNGEEKVIAYASRALKDHEKNYSAYLLEMAAAVFGIEHFDV